MMKPGLKPCWNPLARAALWLLLLCALPLEAREGLDQATSVTVNGLEATQAVTLPAWHEALGANGVAQAAVFVACTGNHEIEVRYPEKRIRLEFFSEENPDADLETLLSGKNWRQLPLKAELWIYWEDLTRSQDEVRVDGKRVGADLTFAEFARRFPKSARQAMTDFETLPDLQNHMLRLSPEAKEGEEAEEWPYAPALIFSFREGRLFQLTLWHGIAC